MLRLSPMLHTRYLRVLPWSVPSGLHQTPTLHTIFGLRQIKSVHLEYCATRKTARFLFMAKYCERLWPIASANAGLVLGFIEKPRIVLYRSLAMAGSSHQASRTL